MLPQSEPSGTLVDRYFELIDQIVTITLKGQLRSKEQIYQMLAAGTESGTGEIFERCLSERLTTTAALVQNSADEAKQARASRSLRAMQAINGEWERYQKAQQASSVITTAAQAILQAPAGERFEIWLGYFDPNQANRLTLDGLKQLAQTFDKAPLEDADVKREIQQLSSGMRAGIDAYQRLEGVLIEWIYQTSSAIGFEGETSWGPWRLWSERVNHPVPKQLFQTIGSNQSIAEWVRRQSLDLQSWVELVVLLQSLRQALATWFEQQPYDSKWGLKQTVSTYLTFAAIWCEILNGLNDAADITCADREQLVQGCFQTLMQILRSFSQQSYFPMYGGIFALFSGDYLKNAISYLDEPLKRVEGTQEKARILTLLGYSQRTVGRYDRALDFHQQALDIARSAADQPCEIANLNHLSRIYLAQKNYGEAINYSQRALILARQAGDRLGEANALTNLGYSEVLSAQALERLDRDDYELAVNYLQQGLALAEKQGDRQSQSLCYNSLGIAYVILAEPQTAIPYLEKGVKAAMASGDLYLQGLNFAYLAEACHARLERERAVLAALLAMYLLEQINAAEWRQPAGLLIVLQGQLGEITFEQLRRQLRAELTAVIGVDDYDHLPQLLANYRKTLEG
ncbi:MAG: tetratricopeptide repeat protein [Pegethrix bostrychoides GSE-TBD4-15B]|jgi:tetratricopeptide (TPR) repeat protein|uniref:Tetratricopeptide repeat protein n=1 Tax=Pegethrix bostrychoides GSE-TBD4-15B TaxID=2839662 RepID=A0A951PFX3_9CYAN|nr:tetratricopeptide repeat protein [Pegethrix bostrychoides GSE-TBD4-15B]